MDWAGNERIYAAGVALYFGGPTRGHVFRKKKCPYIGKCRARCAKSGYNGCRAWRLPKQRMAPMGEMR